MRAHPDDETSDYHETQPYSDQTNTRVAPSHANPFALSPLCDKLVARPLALNVVDGVKVRPMAAGGQQSLFVDCKGSLFSCGSYHGAFGPTSIEPDLRPSILSGVSPGGVMAVSAGTHHYLAIAADGSVWSWGFSCGGLGHEDKEYVEGELIDRRLYWSRASTGNWPCPDPLLSPVTRHLSRPHGALTAGDLVPKPKKIDAFLGRRVVCVSAGANHSLAATDDGAVFSWGKAQGGKLGHDYACLEGKRWSDLSQILAPYAESAPRKIEAAFAGQCIIAVSAGKEHSLALSADGSAWSWGDGSWGILGHGDNDDQLLPKRVEAFSGVVALSAGFSKSLAVTRDGSVWSWGKGATGQLGHGDQQQQLLPKQIEVEDSDQRFIDISAGRGHSLALTSNGFVWSWGLGATGQLGHGDLRDQWRPKKIETLVGVVAVSAHHGDHSIALTGDGAFWSWGAGGAPGGERARDVGQLGHGSDVENQLHPKEIGTTLSLPTRGMCEAHKEFDKRQQEAATG